MRNANNRGNHEVRLIERSHAHRSSRAEDYLNAGNAGFSQPDFELASQLGRCHRDHARTPFAALLKRCIQILACSQRGYGIAVGIALDDAQCALPDGTGRAQDGDLLQRFKSMNAGQLSAFRRSVALIKRTTARGPRAAARRCGPAPLHGREAASRNPLRRRRA